MTVVPNSAGAPEPDTALRELWSAEARVASAAARRGRMRGSKKDREKAEKEVVRPVVNRGERVAAASRAGVAATQGGLASRAQRGMRDHQQREDEKTAARKAQKIEDAEKKKGSGAAKKPAAPKATGEGKDAEGNRTVKYDDGSTVTVRKDGSATHRSKDGKERTGKYADPKPKEPEPEGFKGDTEKKATPKPTGESERSFRGRQKAATAASRKRTSPRPRGWHL